MTKMVILRNCKKRCLMSSILRNIKKGRKKRQAGNSGRFIGNRKYGKNQIALSLENEAEYQQMMETGENLGLHRMFGGKHWDWIRGSKRMRNPRALKEYKKGIAKRTKEAGKKPFFVRHVYASPIDACEQKVNAPTLSSLRTRSYETAMSEWERSDKSLDRFYTGVEEIVYE